MKTHGKVARIIAALAAIAVSSIALAEHSKGHGKDKGQGPGPKVSIDVTNLCEFGDGSMDNPIPDNILRVTTTVEDVSDDPRRAIDVETVTVTGLQFVEPVAPPKKDKWKSVGATVSESETGIDMYTIEFVRDINVCEHPRVEDGAKALNAHVQVMLPDGQNFMRMCDDDESNNVYDDAGNLIYDPELDESRIDLDNYDPAASCAD